MLRLMDYDQPVLYHQTFSVLSRLSCADEVIEMECDFRSRHETDMAITARVCF